MRDAKHLESAYASRQGAESEDGRDKVHEKACLFASYVIR